MGPNGGTHTFTNCAINGDGNLFISANGTIENFQSGNTITADIYIASGTINMNHNISPAGNITMVGGNLGGTGNINLGGNLNWSGGTIGGTGTLTVAGTTTLTNGTTLDTRTLTLNGGGAFDSYLNMNNFANLVIPAGRTLTCTTSGNTPWGGTDGTLTLAGTLIKNGPGFLAFDVLAFQNTGTIHLNQGDIYLGFWGKNGTHTNATFNIADGSFFGPVGGTHTFTGCSFKGRGNFGKGGSANISSFTGNTIAPGFLSTGSIGIQNYMLNLASNTYKVELASGGNDLLASNAAITLGGTLDISFLGGFTPTIGDDFMIMTCDGGCSGDFTTINHPGSNPNAWEINHDIPNEVHLILAQALPVELLRFDGKNTENGVLLHWQTASEQNTESFSVSHSTDGVHFDVIGKVPAKGNSTTIQSYQFPDRTPSEGVNYYRLTMTDFDGSASFSNIISVERPRETDRVLISPNPTKGKITIQLESQTEEMTEIIVMDATGRVVQQQQFSGAMKEIDLTGHAPGVYIMMLNNGYIVVNQRVVLQ